MSYSLLPTAGQKSTPTFVTLILAATFYLTCLGYVLFRFQGDVSIFFSFGNLSRNSPYLPPRAIVFPSAGFDGEFNFFIAHDPLLLRDAKIAPQFVDTPSWRYQRIGYPLMAYLLSAGQLWLIPYVLVVLNVAFIVATTFLLTRYCNSTGISPLWALGYPFFSGVTLSFMYSVAHIAAGFFLLLAIFFYDRRRWGICAAVLAYAILTRETLVVFVFLIVAYQVWCRQWRVATILATSVLPYFAWTYYLRSRLGHGVDMMMTMRHFPWPFVGLWTHLTLLVQKSWHSLQLFQVSMLVVILIMTVGVTLAIKHQRSVLTVFSAVVVAMAYLSRSFLWQNPLDLPRYLADAFPCLLLTFMGLARIRLLVVSAILLNWVFCLIWLFERALRFSLR